VCVFFFFTDKQQHVNGTFILVWLCDVIRLCRASASVVILIKKGLFFAHLNCLNQCKLYQQFKLFFFLQDINLRGSRISCFFSD